MSHARSTLEERESTGHVVENGAGAEEAPAASPPAVEAPGRATVIRPPARLPHLDVPELWHFRELLATLVWRDVVVRYKQTFLGIAWAILVPGSSRLSTAGRPPRVVDIAATAAALLVGDTAGLAGRPLLEPA